MCELIADSGMLLLHLAFTYCFGNAWLGVPTVAQWVKDLVLLQL